ncbi:TetR/AcrR family transcriptional regulator [Kribbia dieselivorans]|uniref:TetR/AcrR family transcriptional regulator n=1 Tax=Kribbia dieselivorans TaxID=331526 RepID=UPI00147019D8|nr:TetR/AcrR family transcriptional regulator [Kribbia dieselivorans]
MSITRPGRRVANKERTRLAIIDSTIALVAARGLSAVTAQDVADAADISRRTFFNYYSSIEAVMADKATRLLGTMSDALEARPAGEPLFESIDHVIAGAFDRDLVEHSSVVWNAARHDVPTARHIAYQLQCVSQQLTDVLQQRITRTGATPDAISVATLAGALTAAFTATQQAWFERTGGDLDDESLTTFTALFRGAVARLGTGFADLEAPSASTHTDPFGHRREGA